MARGRGRGRPFVSHGKRGRPRKYALPESDTASVEKVEKQNGKYLPNYQGPLETSDKGADIVCENKTDGTQSLTDISTSHTTENIEDLSRHVHKSKALPPLIIHSNRLLPSSDVEDDDKTPEYPLPENSSVFFKNLKPAENDWDNKLSGQSRNVFSAIYSTILCNEAVTVNDSLFSLDSPSNSVDSQQANITNDLDLPDSVELTNGKPRPKIKRLLLFPKLSGADSVKDSPSITTTKDAGYLAQQTVDSSHTMSYECEKLDDILEENIPRLSPVVDNIYMDIKQSSPLGNSQPPKLIPIEVEKMSSFTHENNFETGNRLELINNDRNKNLDNFSRWTETKMNSTSNIKFHNSFNSQTGPNDVTAHFGIHGENTEKSVVYSHTDKTKETTLIDQCSDTCSITNEILRDFSASAMKECNFPTYMDRASSSHSSHEFEFISEDEHSPKPLMIDELDPKQTSEAIDRIKLGYVNSKNFDKSDLLFYRQDVHSTLVPQSDITSSLPHPVNQMSTSEVHHNSSPLQNSLKTSTESTLNKNHSQCTNQLNAWMTTEMEHNDYMPSESPFSSLYSCFNGDSPQNLVLPKENVIRENNGEQDISFAGAEMKEESCYDIDSLKEMSMSRKSSPIEKQMEHQTDVKTSNSLEISCDYSKKENTSENVSVVIASLVTPGDNANCINDQANHLVLKSPTFENRRNGDSTVIPLQRVTRHSTEKISLQKRSNSDHQELQTNAVENSHEENELILNSSQKAHTLPQNKSVHNYSINKFSIDGNQSDYLTNTAERIACSNENVTRLIGSEQKCSHSVPGLTSNNDDVLQVQTHHLNQMRQGGNNFANSCRFNRQSLSDRQLVSAETSPTSLVQSKTSDLNKLEETLHRYSFPSHAYNESMKSVGPKTPPLPYHPSLPQRLHQQGVQKHYFPQDHTTFNNRNRHFHPVSNFGHHNARIIPGSQHVNVFPPCGETHKNYQSVLPQYLPKQKMNNVWPRSVDPNRHLFDNHYENASCKTWPSHDISPHNHAVDSSRHLPHARQHNAQFSHQIAVPASVHYFENAPSAYPVTATAGPALTNPSFKNVYCQSLPDQNLLKKTQHSQNHFHNHHKAQDRQPLEAVEKTRENEMTYPSWVRIPEVNSTDKIVGCKITLNSKRPIVESTDQCDNSHNFMSDDKITRISKAANEPEVKKTGPVNPLRVECITPEKGRNTLQSSIQTTSKPVSETKQSEKLEEPLDLSLNSKKCHQNVVYAESLDNAGELHRVTDSSDQLPSSANFTCETHSYQSQNNTFLKKSSPEAQYKTAERNDCSYESSALLARQNVLETSLKLSDTGNMREFPSSRASRSDIFCKRIFGSDEVSKSWSLNSYDIPETTPDTILLSPSERTDPIANSLRQSSIDSSEIVPSKNIRMPLENFLNSKPSENCFSSMMRAHITSKVKKTKEKITVTDDMLLGYCNLELSNKLNNNIIDLTEADEDDVVNVSDSSDEDDVAIANKPPHKGCITPQNNCPTPHVNCPTPQVKCPTPHVNCPTPQVNCPTPHVNCPTPQVNCPTPHVNCPTPHVNCPTPQVNCPTPHVNCPTPQVNCPTPQVNCPTPQVNCPTPHVNCPTPQVNCPTSQNSSLTPQNNCLPQKMLPDVTCCEPDVVSLPSQSQYDINITSHRMVSTPVSSPFLETDIAKYNENGLKSSPGFIRNDLTNISKVNAPGCNYSASLKVDKSVKESLAAKVKDVVSLRPLTNEIPQQVMRPSGTFDETFSFTTPSSTVSSSINTHSQMLSTEQTVASLLMLSADASHLLVVPEASENYQEKVYQFAPMLGENESDLNSKNDYGHCSKSGIKTGRRVGRPPKDEARPEKYQARSYQHGVTHTVTNTFAGNFKPSLVNTAMTSIAMSQNPISPVNDNNRFCEETVRYMNLPPPTVTSVQELSPESRIGPKVAQLMKFRQTKKNYKTSGKPKESPQVQPDSLALKIQTHEVQSTPLDANLQETVIKKKRKRRTKKEMMEAALEQSQNPSKKSRRKYKPRQKNKDSTVSHCLEPSEYYLSPSKKRMLNTYCPYAHEVQPMVNALSSCISPPATPDMYRKQISPLEYPLYHPKSPSQNLEFIKEHCLHKGQVVTSSDEFMNIELFRHDNIVTKAHNEDGFVVISLQAEQKVSPLLDNNMISPVSPEDGHENYAKDLQYSSSLTVINGSERHFTSDTHSNNMERTEKEVINFLSRNRKL